MSVTVNTSPALLCAAWRPIIFETSSDRYASTAKAVSAVSSGTGAYARYAITSNVFKVGDVIVGSGFTSVSAAYNVTQTVTVVNASWVETDLLFVASGTGSGTITRANENFQMKCQTYVFDQTAKSIPVTADPQQVDLGTWFTLTDHGYSIGDIILITGTTSYNGAYIIRSLDFSSSIFTLDAPYTTNQTATVRRGTLIGTKRQAAITVSSNIRFRFNPSGHLQTALSQDLIDSAPSILQTPCVNSIKNYAIKFTEEFDDADGLLQTHDMILSSNRVAVRAAWQHGETQSLADYTLGSSTQKFLTKAPLIKYIRVGEEEQLSFLTSTVPNWRVTVQKYDLGGNALSLVNMTLYDILDYRAIVPINSNMFDATISKFEVWITNSSGTQQSEKRTFIVDKNKYQNAIRFHFENSLGGFDAYTCTGDFTISNKTDKTTFRKILSPSFATRDRGTTDFGVNSDVPKEIFSSLLSNAEAIWLQELLYSPCVFIKNIGETVFTPVNIYSNTQMVYDSKVPTQIKVAYTHSNAPIALNN